VLVPEEFAMATGKAMPISAKPARVLTVLGRGRATSVGASGSSPSFAPLKLSNTATYGPTRLGPITDRPPRKFGNG